MRWSLVKLSKTHPCLTPSDRVNLLSAEQDERIAQFFEDHPFFYDKTLSDYKNKHKKDATLKKFADEIGIDRE